MDQKQETETGTELLETGIGASVNKQREVRLIYGRTGSGKTVLARALQERRCEELRAPGLIVDTLEEHDTVPLIDIADLDRLINPARNRRDSKARFRVFAPDDTQLYSIWLTLKICTDPVVVYIDEIGYFSSPGWLAAGLSEMVRYGRHYGIDLICVARRPAETARELTAQATHIYSFKQTEPIDLEYLRKVLPAGAGDNLESLAPRCYISASADGTWQRNPPVKIISA